MFIYETHVHTLPVSKCARATVRENLEYYKSVGYSGIFITNHFIDGNIGVDRSLPYADKIEFYFSDYEEALRLSDDVGISVFCGVEMSYGGTDFLVYGLDKAWYLRHPEIEGMKKSELLTLLKENGALIIQAHPFREAAYIDHIRLFPRHVHGVEIYNACRTDLENKMAEIYAEKYGLIRFSASDNHICKKLRTLGGMASQTPIKDERDFISRVLNGEMSCIRYDVENGEKGITLL